MKQVTAPVVSALSQQPKAIANKMALADIIKLNSEETTLIVSAVQSANDSQGKWAKMADVLWGNGKRPEHFDRVEAIRVKDNEMIKFHTSVNNAIVSSYDAPAQKLYHADPESLPMSKQVERTVLRKQVSDHFSTIKRHIVKIKAGSSNGTNTGASSNMDMVVKSLDDAISRLEKEKKPYIGIVEDIKALKVTLASIKKQSK
jgi:hypothetical protein